VIRRKPVGLPIQEMMSKLPYWYPTQSRAEELAKELALLDRVSVEQARHYRELLPLISRALNNALNAERFPQHQIGQWVWLASQFRMLAAADDTEAVVAGGALNFFGKRVEAGKIDAVVIQDLNWVLDSTVRRLGGKMRPEGFRSCLTSDELSAIESRLAQFASIPEFDVDAIRQRVQRQIGELEALSLDGRIDRAVAKADVLFEASARSGKVGAAARSALLYLADKDDAVSDVFGVLGLPRLCDGSTLSVWLKNRHLDPLVTLTGSGRRRLQQQECVLLLGPRHKLDDYFSCLRPFGTSASALLGAKYVGADMTHHDLDHETSDTPFIYACSDPETAWDLITKPPEHVSGWRVIVDGAKAGRTLRASLQTSSIDVPVCIIGELRVTAAAFNERIPSGCPAVVEAQERRRCDAQHWRGRSSPASSRSTICRVIPAEVSGRSEADEGAAPERECQPEVRTQSQRTVHVPGQCP
jgi:hypothetical protein